jgi:hypothetical protein
MATALLQQIQQHNPDLIKSFVHQSSRNDCGQQQKVMTTPSHSGNRISATLSLQQNPTVSSPSNNADPPHKAAGIPAPPKSTHVFSVRKNNGNGATAEIVAERPSIRRSSVDGSFGNPDSPVMINGQHRNEPIWMMRFGDWLNYSIYM